MSPPVKLCCISDRREVELAVAAGAAVLGFVGEQPSGPGRLDDASIAELIGVLDGRARSWLLTSTVDPDALEAQIARTRPSGVQICDDVALDVYPRLRARFDGLEIVQVIHVSASDDPVAEARALAPHVDGLLLDSGIVSGPDRQLGGTGKTHDWRVSRRLVDAVDVPVWLAGGLRPDNVETALRQVRPAGVDLCSGVRDADYALDEDKVEAFMAAVTRGSQPIRLAEGASLAALQHYVEQLEAMHDWLHVGVVENGFLMSEEVGELHAALRRHARAVARGDEAEVVEQHRAHVAEEIVDVLNYLLAQANRLDIDVEAAFREKNATNQGRSWD